MENDIKVSSEVLSYCGKCKLPLAHIVVAMKNSRTIAKCQCNTCKAVHLYKDPDAVAKKKKTKVVKRPTEVLWSESLFETKKLTSYSMSGKFEKGEFINHPTFGKGVVEKIVGDNKIETLFEQGVKTLIFSAN